MTASETVGMSFARSSMIGGSSRDQGSSAIIVMLVYKSSKTGGSLGGVSIAIFKSKLLILGYPYWLSSSMIIVTV